MSNPLDEGELSAAIQGISINLSEPEDQERGRELLPPKLTISEDTDSSPSDEEVSRTAKTSASPFAGLRLLMPKPDVDSTSTPVSSPINPGMTQCPLDDSFSCSLSSSLFMINKSLRDRDDDDDDEENNDKEDTESEADQDTENSDYSTDVTETNTRTNSIINEEHSGRDPTGVDNRGEGEGPGQISLTESLRSSTHNEPNTLDGIKPGEPLSLSNA